LSSNNRRIVAIAWYDRETYGEIRALMDDGEVLPETYDAWLGHAIAVVTAEKSRASTVIKAKILPDAFIDWCLATNQRPNVSSRTRHVNLAIENYCSGYSASATNSRPREIA
jgi:hypothetical protein